MLLIINPVINECLQVLCMLLIINPVIMRKNFKLFV